MSGVWFVSDLHFGHRLVAGYRGFGENTEAHDDAVIASWVKDVDSNDTVYVLGDISGGGAWQENRALDLIETLPGTKHLIAGNHDSVASIHRTGWRRAQRFREAFISVRDFARIRVNKQQVLLSHYPYLGPGADHPEMEVRYAQYRLPDMGLPLIHGHTHIADQRLHWGSPRWMSANRVEYTPQIHVGWDAWHRAVSLHEVEQMLDDSELPKPQPPEERCSPPAT